MTNPTDPQGNLFVSAGTETEASTRRWKPARKPGEHYVGPASRP